MNKPYNPKKCSYMPLDATLWTNKKLKKKIRDGKNLEVNNTAELNLSPIVDFYCIIYLRIFVVI